MAERFAESIRARDLDTLSAVISEDEDVVFIGTDPDEWWIGHDTIVSVYAQQLEALGPEGVGLAAFDVSAYEQGQAGWFAGRTALVADGDAVPVRISGAARKVEGNWRIVQLHVSIGIPNEQVVGVELPT